MLPTSGNTAEYDARQLFAKRLNDNLTSADVCRRYDDYDNWFDSCRCVESMIKGFLSDKEMEELEKKASIARKWAKVTNNKRLVNASFAQDTLHDYNTYLQVLCHRYKLLVPISDKQGSALRDF